LQQLSPLWQSPEILGQVVQHAQRVPDARNCWIALGVDPSIFTLPSSQQALEDSRSDSEASEPERPPVVIRGPNVTIQGRGNGHSPVTDVAARRVVSLLEELGFQCALNGSAAAHVYSRGETRVLEVCRF
jgi:hypothetical protein